MMLLVMDVDLNELYKWSIFHFNTLVYIIKSLVTVYYNNVYTISKQLKHLHNRLHQSCHVQFPANQ